MNEVGCTEKKYVKYINFQKTNIIKRKVFINICILKSLDMEKINILFIESILVLKIVCALRIRLYIPAMYDNK